MSKPKYWAVVPAAGIGSRMVSEIPKQYLVISGMRVIEHVLSRLCAHPQIEEVVVAIRKDDPWWNEIKVVSETPPRSVIGGDERMNSVYNGLVGLEGKAADNDWVLVHDAARPCVRRNDINFLISELEGKPGGGLLGLSVADTMKKTDEEGNVLETLERSSIWRALTPQMFRYAELKNALSEVISNKQFVTDEAQAMEMAGFPVKMIEGHADNIKITRAQDMVLAEMYLRQQALEPSIRMAPVSSHE